MNASGRAVFFGAIGMMIMLVTVFLLYQRRQARERLLHPTGTVTANQTHAPEPPRRRGP